MMLDDNDKAAIAGRVWEPGQKCPGECRDARFYGQYGDPDDMEHRAHDIPAPDMHDPANLWRALENLGETDVKPSIFKGWHGGVYGEKYGHDWVVDLGQKPVMSACLADAVFAALVALYHAEHPNG